MAHGDKHTSIRHFRLDPERIEITVVCETIDGYAQDRLTFTPMPDGTVVMRAKTKSLLDLKGLLKPPAGTSVSTADMSLGAA